VNNTLYLAWRYLSFHRWKTTVLVLSVTLIIFLPIGLNVLVEESATQLTARAKSTPLLVGAAGSQLELALNSLYFDGVTPSVMPYAETDAIRAMGLADPVPLYVRFKVQSQPVVGTTLDYFGWRSLRFAAGRQMAVIGEAVLGASAAKELGVGIGDAVISSPETVFDLAGVYPLKMQVVGVLKPTLTADDNAVFVDLKTSWIMQGLGHGHQDLRRSDAAANVLTKDENEIVANAAVVQYNEITADNIESFHFHGSNEVFPITAVIAVPNDDKSGVLLLGRFEGNDEMGSQIVQSSKVIEALLGTVFTVRQFVVFAVSIVSVATLATACLVFMLSLRLRQRERLTLFKLGAPKPAITGILLAEVLGVIVISALLAAGLALATRHLGGDVIRLFLI
jgi:putative ABC transport system permease protein